MSWRATATTPDRIFAALPYLLPLSTATVLFGQSVIELVPALGLVLFPLVPLALLYMSPILGLVLFMVLYLLVVRNDSISYFIRFNTMQALLIGFIIIIFSMLLSFIANIAALMFMYKVIANVIFLGVLAMAGFSIVQSLRGIYPEIPSISDAAKTQVF
jgi:uncharacterized membrane protein